MYNSSLYFSLLGILMAARLVSGPRPVLARRRRPARLLIARYIARLFIGIVGSPENAVVIAAPIGLSRGSFARSLALSRANRDSGGYSRERESTRRRRKRVTSRKPRKVGVFAGARSSAVPCDRGTASYTASRALYDRQLPVPFGKKSLRPAIIAEIIN